MTTPQSILERLSYNMKDLNDMLCGKYEDEETRQNIYEMIKNIEIEIINTNNRMELLEDKMNIIIRLLGK